MSPPQRKLAVIMFSDIEGYTAMMQSDETVGLKKAKLYRSSLDRLVNKNKGEILNHYGDGSLTIFDSAVNAVKCAHEFQMFLLTQGASDQVPVRIGLHDGDIVIDGNDVFGNGINIASRLESLGIPGSVLLSQSVCEKIKGHTQFKSVSLGEFHFKNVDGPMEVFALTNEPLAVPNPKNLSGKLEPLKYSNYLKFSNTKIQSSILFLVLLVLAIILTWNPILSNLFKDKKGSMLESIQSLVVLPFQDYSGSEEQEFWINGMYASLTTELGKLGKLRVISKTSARSYAETDKNIQQIAEELNVDAIVETSVLSLGDSIKLQLNIINAFPEELSVWTRSYSVVKGEILNLYNTITANIAEEINHKLTSEQEAGLKNHKFVDPQVYETYLKGTLRMGDLTKKGQEDAIGYFEQAIDMDESFAPAYAGIGGVWAVMKQMDYVTPDEADPNIERYLDKALKLDSTLAEVFYFKAVKSVWTDYNWEQGGREFRKALQINPNLSDARGLYSHYLMCMGKWKEAREEMDMALEIDPLNPFVQVLNGMVLLNESEFVKCIETLEPVAQFIPNNPLVIFGLMVSYYYKGMDLKCLEQANKFVASVGNPRALDTLNIVFDERGLKEAIHAAVTVIDEDIETYPSPTQVMYSLYCMAGDVDKTLYWLERNYIRRDPTMPYITAFSLLKDLRNEPRFQRLVKRMKLEHTLEPINE